MEFKLYSMIVIWFGSVLMMNLIWNLSKFDFDYGVTLLFLVMRLLHVSEFESDLNVRENLLSQSRGVLNSQCDMNPHKSQTFFLAKNHKPLIPSFNQST